MRKNILWTSIAFTAVGIVNLILFIVLSHFGIVGVRNMAYLFAIGVIATPWVPMLLNLLFKTNFSIVLLICYNVFCLLSIAVGSLWGGYGLIPYFDKILHFSSGVLFAILIYEIYANNKNNRLNLFWVFMLTFSFAMMCGGVWEIYEFSTDAMFDNNAQVWQGFVGREALVDTMGDLISDLVGSVLGAVVAVLMQWRKNKTEVLKDKKIESEKNNKSNTNEEVMQNKTAKVTEMKSEEKAKQEKTTDKKKDVKKVQNSKNVKLSESNVEKNKLLKKMKYEGK